MKNSFWRRFIPFLAAYLFVETTERIYILFQEWGHVDHTFFSICKVFSLGLFTNALESIFTFVPIALYLLILPKKWHEGRFDKIVYGVILFSYTVSFVFEEVAEVLFWNEFAARFNFIAVDYLIYTKEVVGNIEESYPMAIIFLGIGIASVIISAITWKWTFARESEVSGWKTRIVYFLGNLVAAIGCVALFQMNPMNASNSNRYDNELGKDGISSFIYAFFHNELDYNEFYATQDTAITQRILRQQLGQGNCDFVNVAENDISRNVKGSGEEKRMNVVIVVMESMGYEFFNETGYEWRGFRDLTPCLTELSKEGIFFPNTYATGTRTVRGLEAVSLSVPPLPGMSIVRRSGNENLYGLGSIFAERGYDCKFVYGGYGYFDNMNGFFEGNGFTPIDRVEMEGGEVTFANIWGVCDEDLFRKAIAEANKSFESGKKFLQVVMTTSNHRPFTYPEGKIDIPIDSGRAGGVKYADFAVGELVKEAKKQPWFKETVFIFIADHGAGTAGKMELNPESHQIPFIIYAPEWIHSKRVEKEISQIDAIPTLLGLLNFTYVNKSYGSDVLRDDYFSRYFISNYQKVGYIEGQDMVVLKPVKDISVYQGDKEIKHTENFKEKIEAAISYYQSATRWREQLKKEKNSQ